MTIASAQAHSETADESDSWFAWAMPASMAAVNNLVTQEGPPLGEEQQRHREQQRQQQQEIEQRFDRQVQEAQLDSEPQRGDDLKLSQWMAGAMVRSQADKFNERLDSELSSHRETIEELKSRLDGQPRGSGSAQPSVTADVKLTIDSMRRDLESHREMLMIFNGQIPSLRADLSTLRNQVHSLGGMTGGAPRGSAGNGSVSLQQHEQTFNALQEEIRSVNQAMQVAAVNAGLLAVASAECSFEERAKLFETLKAREQALSHSGNSDILAIASIGAANRLVGDLTSQPEGIEFTVRIDKSTGRPLGLQVDHENGNCLVVEAVLDGLMRWWNEANPNLAVQPNDLIVGVNGKRGDSKLMLKEVALNQMLHFAVVRPLGNGNGYSSFVGSV